MSRTLIAYASKGGVTRESAAIIAEVLRGKYGFEVDVVDLGKNRSPDLTPYRNVIVGGGVRWGKIYGEALKFLDEDFGDRKVVFYISTIDVEEKARPKAEENYIQNTIAERPKLKPVSSILLGGRLKMLGMKTADFTDVNKVKAWADELGTKLEK